MISIEAIKKALDMLGMLPRFPLKPSVVAEVGNFLDELCEDDKRLEKLVRVVLDECREWPGPVGLREIYNREFRRTKYIDLASIYG